MKQAAAIHSAIWMSVFQGQNSIRVMDPDQQRVVEFKMPPVEQILDFVRRYLACTLNGEQRVMVEASMPAWDSLDSAVVKAVLSREFAME